MTMLHLRMTMHSRSKIPRMASLDASPVVRISPQVLCHWQFATEVASHDGNFVSEGRKSAGRASLLLVACLRYGLKGRALRHWNDHIKISSSYRVERWWFEGPWGSEFQSHGRGGRSSACCRRYRSRAGITSILSGCLPHVARRQTLNLVNNWFGESLAQTSDWLCSGLTMIICCYDLQTTNHKWTMHRHEDGSMYEVRVKRHIPIYIWDHIKRW